MLVAALLLVGIVGLLASQPGLGLRNWLVVLFQINADVGSLPADPLRVFSGLDIAVLALVATAFLGFWPILGRADEIWVGIAAALPVVGIAVLLVSGEAGRSGVMVGGLVIAWRLLKSAQFRPLAYLGGAANTLLLIGDLATGGARALVVAILVGVGYLLLAGWFLLTGVRLLRWGHSQPWSACARPAPRLPPVEDWSWQEP